MTTVIGILLIIMAVFLVFAVLMQSSKDHRHGGTVAGGAETFFGKTKGKTMDALFSKLTTVVAIIFVVLVIFLYVIQPNVCVWCGSTEHEAVNAEDCPVIVAQAEAAAQAEAEAEEAPVEEAPVEEAPVEEAPVEEAPVEG